MFKLDENNIDHQKFLIYLAIRSDLIDDWYYSIALEESVDDKTGTKLLSGFCQPNNDFDDRECYFCMAKDDTLDIDQVLREIEVRCKIHFLEIWGLEDIYRKIRKEIKEEINKLTDQMNGLF